MLSLLSLLLLLLLSPLLFDDARTEIRQKASHLLLLSSELFPEAKGLPLHLLPSLRLPCELLFHRISRHTQMLQSNFQLPAPTGCVGQKLKGLREMIFTVFHHFLQM
jgi:hypothetical protein